MRGNEDFKAPDTHSQILCVAASCGKRMSLYQFAPALCSYRCDFWKENPKELNETFLCPVLVAPVHPKHGGTDHIRKAKKKKTAKFLNSPKIK